MRKSIALEQLSHHSPFPLSLSCASFINHLVMLVCRLVNYLRLDLLLQHVHLLSFTMLLFVHLLLFVLSHLYLRRSSEYYYASMIIYQSNNQQLRNIMVM
jgi:type IV secretory pathway TrbL component